ncbi:RND transporter, hydrophobe/amphiphile efflux-1 (HAE1) family [Myxococcus xanthus DK 1622]|uniref:RND transporter, hydrophobe/amphiphile efflux-1 (HAE1) family n=1 Tax=Myxococcus xanthus (strain DK1622) TaxID=246197 RepID=Q1D847_MYXXD|nr:MULTISPECIES: efflux RND transporter permease subunit [Myxococcus]ABF86227.1 RND transporter, hydrophobe/amphiphile efflux-1 (HAE1) family [Myxococcus xanthus DK 1622]NOJ55196.1 efflux RND transporter permease subunit [Myxococcus xanthus]QPM82442.1 efflux RND transporter permease subunit [Myxococcus xanthus]QVW64747.1 efflux RND transporter permease subunit [Myxococcus xanthus DZ2]QZZ50685.1 Multidrug resistance protein MdtB [Myxococcus xanthus]
MLKTFITRPVFTAMLMLAVVVFGINAYPRIGVDQFPDVEFPVVTVTTVLPGADPESMEKNVSDPLEEALNTLNGVEQLRSINLESVSQIVVRFTLDTKVDVASQDVRDRVQATLSKLPTEIETPVVEKFDIGAAPIMTLSLSGALPIEEMTRVAEDVVKPALQRQPGVGSIDVVGGREREIQIVVDPERLRGFGLAVSDVSQAVQAQNLDVPGGRTMDSGRERVVRLTSEAKSVDELRNIIIASPNGAPVRVRDVADVVDGPEEARSSAKSGDRSAVALVVRKQSGSNTVQVAESIKESLGEVNSLLPEGVRTEMVTDNSRFIRSSIAAVQFDLVLGGFLAVLIVLVFLRNLNSTLVAAVALPVSVVGTFAVMAALGFTFNVVTMLALTLSIGLLIDDAIVVIENIVRHLEEGKTPMQAALEGASQIALAVFAVTLAIVAVFIPVAFMDGTMGMFFYQFGVTVAVAVLISYAVSMTLTPMLSARMLSHHGNPTGISAAVEKVLVATETGYRNILASILRHRAITLVIAVVVLFLTLFMASFLKFTFIPEQDNGNIKLAVELPIGSTLQETQAELDALDAQVRALPGIDSTFATAGGGVQEEVHKGELLINLVPLKDRAFNQGELKTYLRGAITPRSGVTVTVQDIAAVGGGGARTQQIQFNLRGDNWDEVIKAAEKVQATMRQNPGLVDVDMTFRSGKPQYDVKVDRERAASLGVPAASLGATLRAFLGRDKFGDYREGGETYEIKVALPPQTLASADALGKLTVRSMTGQLVELRNFATITPADGPVQIDRESQKRQITLLANLASGYALSDGINFLNAYAEKELPKTVIYDFEGNAKEMGKAVAAFGSALLLGIILIYMILAAQFESFVHPFTIMMSLPFALIGAIGGLLVTGQAMSMFALIGVIMLMGLVVKNGILLVDFTLQLREEGKTATEALLQAAPVRLRPILMTTIAMIAGMIPVAVAKGDGAETRAPMAITIIGGLVTSTFLTLGVVPVVYSLMDQLTEKFKRRKGPDATSGTPHAVGPKHGAESPSVAAAARVETA